MHGSSAWRTPPSNDWPLPCRCRNVNHVEFVTMAREMTRTGTLIGRHQPRRLLIWSGLITLAAIVALLTLWLRPGPPPPATTPALIGAIEDRVIASGTIVPSRSLDLSFQMSGVVTAVLAAEGEQVRTGQPLARLDDRDLRGRVAQLQADLASAEARREQARRGNATPEELRSAEASVANARAQLDRARTNNVTAADIAIAEAELRGAQARYDALAAGAGPEELSAAQARAEQTRASLEERRASLSAARTSAESQVQQAANALRDAQAEYSRIYWDNRELEKLPGDLPPERLDQEAAAERAVANAEEGLRQARVAYEQARQALALSLLGGLGGVLIALAIAAVVTLSGIFAAPVSPVAVLVALGFSFAVGLFFGIYPARRAARLSPIDALQSE